MAHSVAFTADHVHFNLNLLKLQAHMKFSLQL